jgi:hypothetical protein
MVIGETIQTPRCIAVSVKFIMSTVFSGGYLRSVSDNRITFPRRLLTIGTEITNV